ncbi:hypothetical protein RND71_032091 [Anisodus tanguticus]|uniref:EF-hand domain-containing protein n=1 Tax=Anisodus tanguticus TaxID=243964 RepID=A0AAE1RCJ2_9SOLA|nr:hypothetical protein RND71_032091 [Anisodus tanguticus]
MTKKILSGVNFFFMKKKMVGVAPNCNTKNEKMKKIFDKFDTNKDEHLGMTEVLAWIRAVESTLNNDLQWVPTLISLYFATYRSFLVGSKGLSYTSFPRIYVDGLRNVDLDFITLGLHNPNAPIQQFPIELNYR